MYIHLKVHEYRSNSGPCAAFLANYDTTSSANVTYSNMQYDLPPWSISILPDCKNEIFNTAKVRKIHLLLKFVTRRDNPCEIWMLEFNFSVSSEICEHLSFFRCHMFLTIQMYDHKLLTGDSWCSYEDDSCRWSFPLAIIHWRGSNCKW